MKAKKKTLIPDTGNDISSPGKFIDRKKLEKIMIDFFRLTGLGTSILDPEGNILVGTGRQRICSEFHWAHPEAHRNCLESDRKFTCGLKQGEYKIYKCRNGLFDVATPLIIEGVHVANFFMGQFLYEHEPLPIEKFREQAEKFEFDEEEYLKAMMEAPRLSRETVKRAMDLMMNFAGIISSQVMNNMKLTVLLAEKEKLNAEINKINTALKESLVRNQALIDAIPDLVFLFSSEGIFLDFHSPSVDSLYLPPEKFLNRPVRKVLPGYLAELTIEKLGNLFKTGQSQTYEYEMNDGGSIRYFDTRMVLCGNDRAMAIVREITEQKKVQIELTMAKEKAEGSDRLKSAFLANMSHEIRTPMNGIIGFAVLMKNNDIDDKKRGKYIDIISTNAEYLLRLIDDIIDISRIETGSIEVSKDSIATRQLFEELFKMFYDRKPGVEIRFSSGLFPVISSDRTKLTQILSNLIGNAIKFTDNGFVEYSVTVKKEFIEFRVEDTGKGIAGKDRDLIFDRFAQGSNTVGMNRGGTGLGLAISKAYVEKMGGSIWFDSKPGKGTIFFFTIPYIPASKEK